ncbi:MAG: hypothetical protein ACYSR0_12940 [Planctomycetota bacterium]|jgi:hypothetical protein
MKKKKGVAEWMIYIIIGTITLIVGVILVYLVMTGWFGSILS